MIYRFRVTVTIGPTDRPILDVFYWLADLLVAAHAHAPFPITVGIEREDS